MSDFIDLLTEFLPRLLVMWAVMFLGIAIGVAVYWVIR
jgi:hypothetical protein